MITYFLTYWDKTVVKYRGTLLSVASGAYFKTMILPYNQHHNITIIKEKLNEYINESGNNR